jgi:hypothetical protein
MKKTILILTILVSLFLMGCTNLLPHPDYQLSSSQELPTADMYLPRGDTQLREVYFTPNGTYSVVISRFDSAEKTDNGMTQLLGTYNAGNIGLDGKRTYVMDNVNEEITSQIYFYQSGNNTVQIFAPNCTTDECIFENKEFVKWYFTKYLPK